MGTKTGIAWTEATWNPIRGCTRVSEGCRNCYAERVAHRFSGPGKPYEGLTTADGRWNGKILFVEDHLLDPLRWQRPRMIFVNSMSDLFHENLPDADIDRIVTVMALAGHHVFQVLTKRPERMRDYLHALARARERLEVAARALGYTHVWKGTPLLHWPLPNVWWGTSVEDGKTWRARVPLLQGIGAAHAAVLWLSIEPQVGEIKPLFVDSMGIAWLVPGGESQSGARPFQVEWARQWIEYGHGNRQAVFIKQLGSVPLLDGRRLALQDRAGANPEEWPADVRVREYPANRLVEVA